MIWAKIAGCSQMKAAAKGRSFIDEVREGSLSGPEILGGLGSGEIQRFQYIFFDDTAGMSRLSCPFHDTPYSTVRSPASRRSTSFQVTSKGTPAPSPAEVSGESAPEPSSETCIDFR